VVSTVQRYYASSYGRFNTVDPYAGSADPKSPGTWNRYGYTGGDPVNSNDPRGLDNVCGPNGTFDGEGCTYTGGGDYGGGDTPPVLNPCVQIYEGVSGSVNCVGPVTTVATSAQPSQPSQPPCSVEVGYVTNVFGSPFSHSFFDIDYYGASEYIEVSPSLGGIFPTMHVNFTSTGIYNDSTQGIDFWNDTSPSVCLDAAGIAYDSSHLGPSLYLGPISNSNSFVSTILNEVGITAPPLVSGPPNAIGWGLPVLPVPVLTNPFPILPRLL
jgi:hypothetical protein